MTDGRAADCQSAPLRPAHAHTMRTWPHAETERSPQLITAWHWPPHMDTHRESHFQTLPGLHTQRSAVRSVAVTYTYPVNGKENKLQSRDKHCISWSSFSAVFPLKLQVLCVSLLSLTSAPYFSLLTRGPSLLEFNFPFQVGLFSRQLQWMSCTRPNPSV